MKKLALAFAAILVALSAWAQTPEEILEKMDKVMEHGDTEGMIMTMTMKIPIIGAVPSRMYILGDKSRVETQMLGQKLVIWEDATTTWTYNSKKNEVTIEDNKADKSSDADDTLGMLDGVADGYDLKLQKETADAWYIVCKKRKDNTNKDDPKKIEISVYKDSYLLKEMKAGVSGVSVIMNEVSFGVSEKDVIISEDILKNAVIVDNRKAK
jgi:outer membrane lipoprotein-sorting protein